jgi:hypothetical protein
VTRAGLRVRDYLTPRAALGMFVLRPFGACALGVPMGAKSRTPRRLAVRVARPSEDGPPGIRLCPSRSGCTLKTEQKVQKSVRAIPLARRVTRRSHHGSSSRI